MMEELLKWVGDKSPGILAVIFCGYVVWQVAKFYFNRFSKTEDKVKLLEKKADETPCALHKVNIDKISEQVESLNHMSKITEDMRLDISFIKGILESTKSNTSPLAQALSPISLTEKGKEVEKDLNARNMIARNWDILFQYLEANIVNKNAYDIQEYIMRGVSVEPEKFLDPESLGILKQYAFNNGNNLAFYAIVFTVIIRDKYLQIKGIDVSEVDANDPGNDKGK